MTFLRPNYLSLDFDTIKDDIITQLQSTDTFKDYNFEGSNIAVLIELIAYLGDINTFYMNRSSKELFLDTVEIYENSHRISQMSGYTPLGYTASQAEVNITLTQDTPGTYFSEGDIVYIPKFKKITAVSNETDIDFVIVDKTYSTVTLDYTESGDPDELYEYQFSVDAKQGTGITYNYTGADISNYKIQLPFYTFDHSQVDNVNSETSI